MTPDSSVWLDRALRRRDVVNPVIVVVTNEHGFAIGVIFFLLVALKVASKVISVSPG